MKMLVAILLLAVAAGTGAAEKAVPTGDTVKGEVLEVLDANIKRANGLLELARNQLAAGVATAATPLPISAEATKPGAPPSTAAAIPPPVDRTASIANLLKLATLRIPLFERQLPDAPRAVERRGRAHLKLQPPLTSRRRLIQRQIPEPHRAIVAHLHLAQVADAARPSGLLLGPRKGGKKHAGKNGNNGDDHQEFDQCETATSFLTSPIR